MPVTSAPRPGLSGGLCLVLLLGGAVAVAGPPAGIRAGVDGAATARRPNIVVILADDVGYSDLGCYGGEIATPNLDGLAAGGLRFTQFYNGARCCPTRASLLTGLYPHQAGIGHMMEDRGHDGYRGDLNASCRTIAEVLRPAGYKSYAVGKWHVTKAATPEQGRANWPLHRGFDRYYGIITGAGNFFDPPTLTRDDAVVTIHTDPEYPAKDYYLTDALSDQAARYVAEHDASHDEEPFFLYLAYTAAHWPMQAREADIAAYQGKYDAGYDPIRGARFARMKQLGLVPPGCELTPTFGDWAKVEHKDWEARCMEVYAAMITSMDRGVGRVVDALRATGELDDTLILFLQDNGGCQETIGRGPGPPRGDAPTLEPFPLDRNMTSAFPARTRDGWPMRRGPANMPGPADTYIAYGEGWANVSNTPFRKYKHFVHEGGIGTPLVMHWPAAQRVAAGGLVRDPAHLIDVMATCVDVAGATYPAEADGRAITPAEGVSLTPVLAGEPPARTAPLFWEHEGHRAVRDGRMKLVAVEDGPWELYDMDADRSETHDLAAERPETVEALAAAWDAWAGRAHVLPLGTWKAPVAKDGAASPRPPRPRGERGQG